MQLDALLTGHRKCSVDRSPSAAQGFGTVELRGIDEGENDAGDAEQPGTAQQPDAPGAASLTLCGGAPEKRLGHEVIGANGLHANMVAGLEFAQPREAGVGADGVYVVAVDVINPLDAGDASRFRSGEFIRPMLGGKGLERRAYRP